MFVTKVITIFNTFYRLVSVKETRDFEYFGYTLFFRLRIARKKNTSTSSRILCHLNQSEAMELRYIYTHTHTYLSLNYARLNFKIGINTFMCNVQAYKSSHF